MKFWCLQISPKANQILDRFLPYETRALNSLYNRSDMNWYRTLVSITLIMAPFKPLFVYKKISRFSQRIIIMKESFLVEAKQSLLALLLETNKRAKSSYSWYRSAPLDVTKIPTKMLTLFLQVSTNVNNNYQCQS